VVSSLRQSCLFSAKNVVLFDAAKKRRVTQEDMCNFLGIAPTTVDRCLKGIGDPKTIEAVKEAAERLGYQRINKWASIKKEFIKGYNASGSPILDEEAICILRARGNHARSISKITGVAKPRLRRIFQKNRLKTENLQAIKQNELSKRQQIEVKMLNQQKAELHEAAQYKKKGSELRNLICKIIKNHKKGVPIEKIARELKISRSLAFRCAYKTKSYFIIKKRRVIKKRSGSATTSTYSTFYARESDMTNAVYEELKRRYPSCYIEKEYPITQTFFGNSIRHIRADFVVKPESGKSVAVEVKHSTTTSSIKVLLGQVFIYKTCDYDVVCVFPKDAFISDFCKKMLENNNVRYWTI
jgi:transcriptional regulator with XRE-family HTH domain